MKTRIEKTIEAVDKHERKVTFWAVIVAVIATALLLSACNTQSINPANKPAQITFNVRTANSTNFTAVVNWGVDHLQYSDAMNGQGYASSYVQSGYFIVRVDSNLPTVQLSFWKDSRVVKTVTINTGAVYTFDKNFNY